MPRHLHVKRSIAIAAMLLAIAALAATLVSGAFSGATASTLKPVAASGPGYASPSAGINDVPADVRAAFAAFRRPVNQQDVAVQQAPAVLETLDREQESAGINPSLARVIYSGATTTLALVPGNGVVCLVETTPASSVCEKAAEVETRGLGLVARVRDGAQTTVAISGVVPDGVYDVSIGLASGGQTRVDTTSDGGYSVVPDGEPKTLTYTNGQGIVQNEPMAPLPQG